jgi:hypothetical protein
VRKDKPPEWHSRRKMSRQREGTQTVSILATVFERMEIKTITAWVRESVTKETSLLVNNNVFDSIAKLVMSIGPNDGWKLVACSTPRYVLPNQIYTITQRMALIDHRS